MSLIYETLYTITLLALAIALIFSWKKIAELKQKNRKLKINYQGEKDLVAWYKNRYYEATQNILRKTNNS